MGNRRSLSLSFAMGHKDGMDVEGAPGEEKGQRLACKREPSEKKKYVHWRELRSRPRVRKRLSAHWQTQLG